MGTATGMDFADGWTWLASACAFALSMSASPGPNNTMLTASGASWGFLRSIPHMLGVSVGFPAMLVAVAFGAGAVLHAAPWLQSGLRWIGAAYLLWLAVQIALAVPAVSGAARGQPLGFTRAALFQWINPKAWVVALGATVTFTTPGVGQGWQAAALGAIFVAVSLPVTAVWTGLGIGAARVLRTPRKLRAFNVAMATLLVASVVGLLAE